MTIAPLYKVYGGVQATNIKRTFDFSGEFWTEGGHTVGAKH
jgi:hypothetical protein